VIPLFKNGDKSLPSNNRPVSLLSCVSKIFEKNVFKNFFKHLLKNKLLYKFQSSFIPGLSTTHQLLEIYHTILTALDSKFLTSITFADVS
jgi:membrane-bound acyltransferase YfiQ involved in biofilm formation